ncbi:E3 ubiquitin-protein ligase RNF168-like isoform X2 [Portunus trituberculatus]|uniref:E3 ubiquitin-protein ligase RNF168-like isoform X2 n=1 Tax=Portunus trituberculatus TaxID=210409 RepID=UPI001E1CFDD0|nr:E3 ubiquitin-protein ligase RNF168-like isoform X2 [Portunus trituberculatus]XP_045138119.1 E3 ubiquitin-protein ligase RNF168-like isoform X2 [Portunus trituberculatus]
MVSYQAKTAAQYPMAGTEVKEVIPTLEDVTCPICLSLLLEPVTLPCHHSLCLSCFQEHVNVTSLFCPLCRTRISVWVRKNTKTNTLVNAKLWTAIQKHFSAQLEARQAGKDILGSTQEVQQKVCEPGEIRQEYENFLAQESQEAIQRKNKEEVASIRLIQQLQEEERIRQQELQQQQQSVAQEDFLLALKLEAADKDLAHSRQKELQDLCARDEDFARQMEVVEGRSPRLPSQNKAGSGSRAVSASPKGPMDMFLSQRGVTKGHQSPASVLSSSDPNTMASQEASSPDSREPDIKRLSSCSSESESEESPSNRHLPSAPGKENLKRWWRGSPVRQGEGSKGRRLGCSSAQRELQLSPDIDSYCISTTTTRQQDCGTSGTQKEEKGTEGEEAEVITKEEETRTNDGDGNPEDSPAHASFLLKWENDKESLATLLSEQQHAEAQLQQELHDRLLAEALQEELNSQTKRVLRTKGSEDEYALRHRNKAADLSQHQPGPSRRNSTKSAKRQATLSEVFSKRHKST